MVTDMLPGNLILACRRCVLVRELLILRAHRLRGYDLRFDSPVHVENQGMRSISSSRARRPSMASASTFALARNATTAPLPPRPMAYVALVRDCTAAGMVALSSRSLGQRSAISFRSSIRRSSTRTRPLRHSAATDTSRLPPAIPTDTGSAMDTVRKLVALDYFDAGSFIRRSDRLYDVEKASPSRAECVAGCLGAEIASGTREEIDTPSTTAARQMISSGTRCSTCLKVGIGSALYANFRS